MILEKQTVEEGAEDKNIYEFFKEQEAETTDGKIVTIKKRDVIQSKNELEVMKANLEAQLTEINIKLNSIANLEK